VTAPEGSRKRIGLYGGTFDPIHIGHLVTGLSVRHALGLDEVRFVVANQPWQKADRDLTSAQLRLEMVAASVAGVEGAEACDIELELGGTSYTARTLAALAEREPRASFWLVVGGDQAANLDTWREVDEIKRLATLVVVDRPGSVGCVPPDGFRYVRVDVPLLEVSSSLVRERVASGGPIRWLVPDAVLPLIEHHRLYRSEA
jgi:nicotinate-nucleotide adenylyltransferase